MNQDTRILAPTVFNVAHGRGIDCMANIIDCGKNKVSGARQSVSLDVDISWPTNMILSTNTNCHKVLMLVIIEYVRNNNYAKVIKNSKDKKERNLTVIIPFDKYLNILGYKLNPNNKKKARTELKKILLVLTSMTLSFSDFNGNFSAIHIFSRSGLRNKYIIAHIDEVYAQYLDSCPMTLYPSCLFSISDKKPNAYRIGYKLCLQYNATTNQKKGSNNRLKITNILKVTSINVDTILTNDLKHWKRRIRGPLEKHLTTLTGTLLRYWKYTAERGLKANEDELNDCIGYLNTYIEFDLIENYKEGGSTAYPKRVVQLTPKG